MKYYLVALFDKESTFFMEKIQKDVCKRYKLHNDFPVTHITLEVLTDPDIEELSSVVSNILKPYKHFKVKINGNIDFDPSHRVVKLKIENQGYIVRLARKINSELSLHKFKITENKGKWDLHVPLGNTNNKFKEMYSEYYAAACTTGASANTYPMLKVTRIELWKATNNRNKPVIKSFPLRKY